MKSNPIALRNLGSLSSPVRFRELCIANAAIDAVLMPEWEFRYFSYDKRWSTEGEMASLRDGSGSHHFALFTEGGVTLKCSASVES